MDTAKFYIIVPVVAENAVQALRMRDRLISAVVSENVLSDDETGDICVCAKLWRLEDEIGIAELEE